MARLQSLLEEQEALAITALNTTSSDKEELASLVAECERLRLNPQVCDPTSAVELQISTLRTELESSEADCERLRREKHREQEEAQLSAERAKLECERLRKEKRFTDEEAWLIAEHARLAGIEAALTAAAAQPERVQRVLDAASKVSKRSSLNASLQPAALDQTAGSGMSHLESEALQNQIAEYQAACQVMGKDAEEHRRHAASLQDQLRLVEVQAQESIANAEATAAGKESILQGELLEEVATYRQSASALQSQLLASEEAHGAALEAAAQEVAAEKAGQLSRTCESSDDLASAMAIGEFAEVEAFRGELEERKQMIKDFEFECEALCKDENWYRTTTANAREQLRLVEQQAQEQVVGAAASASILHGELMEEAAEVAKYRESAHTQQDQLLLSEEAHRTAEGEVEEHKRLQDEYRATTANLQEQLLR